MRNTAEESETIQRSGEPVLSVGCYRLLWVSVSLFIFLVSVTEAWDGDLVRNVSSGVSEFRQVQRFVTASEAAWLQVRKLPRWEGSLWSVTSGFQRGPALCTDSHLIQEVFYASVSTSVISLTRVLEGKQPRVLTRKDGFEGRVSRRVK